MWGKMWGELCVLVESMHFLWCVSVSGPLIGHYPSGNNACRLITVKHHLT